MDAIDKPASSDSDRAQAGEQWLSVGRVGGLHGVRGWVKIISHTDPAAGILQYAPWVLANGKHADEPARPIKVAHSKFDGARIRVQFEGITDRDQAATLLGMDVRIRRDQLDPLSEDSYYWTDLIGCEVRNERGVVLGRVSSLMGTGANDVLVIQPPSPAGADTAPQPTLVPFVMGQYVREVDLQQRIIHVDWDESF